MDADEAARLIAFYLPQFHPIPENDAWWGKGFTEWTNVAGAQPLFPGHYQPHLPADLGFYDLRVAGVRQAQADLAREHGIHGFCYYHYWFQGRRLLQRPLDEVLASGAPDFPFCLCWANEPWSRRWDGSEQELLVPQEHSFESDIAFIHDVLPLLQDPRYIQVGGKPILLVYRVGLVSDPHRVFERWREICVEHGLPGLHVCMAETFGAADPFEHGCDSAVEFPPHKIVAHQVTDIPGRIEGLDPGFCGKIYDYAEVVANEISAAEPDYTRYSTLMFGWDNTSRRGMDAHVCKGFSPELMELWLEHACERAERCFIEDARLVFINAWNEWGEGTYLEPDRRYGRAVLETVRAVLHSTTSTQTTVALLRQRLAQDEGALKALDRLAGRIASLESAMEHALALARRSASQGVCGTLSPVEPLGLSPRRLAGNALLERLGSSERASHGVLRQGEFLHCSGWAIPGDRKLTSNNVCFLQLRSVANAETCYYGYVLRHLKRDDVLARLTLDSGKALWSGFVFAASTAQLPPDRYTLSLLFPAAGSDLGSAIEIGFNCTLEIVA